MIFTPDPFDETLSILLMLCLLPFFIVRSFHYLWTRVWFPDEESAASFDSFYDEFSEYISLVEIRPARTIRLLNFIPSVPSDGKPVLLFIHGSVSRMGHLHNQIRFCISNNIHVIAFDMLGCGKSEVPFSGDFSLDSHLKDILAIAERFIPKTEAKVVLIGHSAGAALAMAAANTIPTTGIILLAPVAFDDYEKVETFAKRGFSAPAAFLWLIRPIMVRILGHRFFCRNVDKKVARLEVYSSSRNPVFMYKRYYLGMKLTRLITDSPDAKLVLHKPCSTLTVAAAEDGVTPAAGAKRNHEHLCGFGGTHVFELIEDAAHGVCVEKPELVNGFIYRFLMKLTN